MYRERLVATPTHSDSARRLQLLLLDYHDFRQYKATHSLLEHTFRIADWQAERLKATHADLYQHPGYHTGLEFLLTDLYAPAGMTQRDDNIDRVFPKMVKWLPDNLLDTFAGNVAGDADVLCLAANLVDFVNVDDPEFGTLYVIIRSLQKAQDDVLDIFTDITCLGQGRCISDAEGYVEHLCECSRQECFP